MHPVPIQMSLQVAQVGEASHLQRILRVNTIHLASSASVSSHFVGRSATHKRAMVEHNTCHRCPTVLGIIRNRNTHDPET